MVARHVLTLSRCYHRHAKVEYVYGLSSVLSALHAQKRRLDGVYLQEMASPSKKKDGGMMEAIVEQCKALNIPTTAAEKGRLNDLTQNKPHQGVVLKASPRKPIDISHLSWNEHDQHYAVVESSARDIVLHRPARRWPFWIALDEVQDPQNLGSILRTAHFFGVDGVVICSKNSAPPTPAVSRVSAGALEVMDIYATTNLMKFLKVSGEQGWHVVGAAAAEATHVMPQANLERLPEKPLLLVFGNEGTGLRTNIKAACHALVTIPGADPVGNGEPYKGYVDSLNVGVAVGVLVATILKA